LNSSTLFSLKNIRYFFLEKGCEPALSESIVSNEIDMLCIISAEQILEVICFNQPCNKTITYK